MKFVQVRSAACRRCRRPAGQQKLCTTVAFRNECEGCIALSLVTATMSDVGVYSFAVAYQS
jgi:hypothetical protein